MEQDLRQNAECGAGPEHFGVRLQSWLQDRSPRLLRGSDDIAEALVIHADALGQSLV